MPEAVASTLDDRLLKLRLDKARSAVATRTSRPEAAPSGPGLSMRSLPMAGEAAAGGALGAVSGLANILSMGAVDPVAAAMNGGVNVAPGNLDLEGAAARRGMLGNYPPTNPAERQLDKGIRAAVPAAALGLVAGPLGALGQGAATGLAAAGAEAVAPGDEVASAVSQFIGSIVGGGAFNLGAKTVRAALGRPGNEMLEASRAAGVTPRSPGSFTDSATAGRVEQALASSTGAQTIHKAAEQTQAEILAAVERVAVGRGAATTAEQAGAAIKRGGQGYINTFRGEAQKRYNKVWSLISAKTKVPTASTVMALRGTAAEVQNPRLRRLLIPKKFANIARVLKSAKGMLSFNDLKQMRTWAGDELTKFSPQGKITAKRWKQVYDGLTADLRQAAEDAGPEALAAFDDATKFWNDGIKVVQKLRPLLKKDDPDRIYAAVLAGKPGEIRAMRANIGEPAWNEVAAFTLRRMGLPKAGSPSSEFSSTAFLRAWDNLTEPAKRALFGGTANAQSMKDLDNIAMIARGIQRGQSYVNRSNTAGTQYFIGALTGGATIAGGVNALATAVVAPWAASKLWTSPAFVRWLATPVGKNRIPARLSALVGVVSAEPELEPYIHEFLRAVSEGQ